MEFYNVKARKKVEVPDSQIKKLRTERQTKAGIQYRYAVTAEVDGSKLFKFVSESTYKSLDVPEIK
ncbi:MAG: hypothetical protein SNJ70_04000 [Armatimonadota bacterium]